MGCENLSALGRLCHRIWPRKQKGPKGTQGLVFWEGTRYNPYSHTDKARVGIDVDGKRMFLNTEYVEVIGWEARLATGQERKRAIRNYLFSQKDWEWSRFVGKTPGWKAFAD